MLLLILVLWGLLQFSAVQTWVVNRIAASFSKKLNTKVSIRKVDISFFNKLKLHDLVVEDKSHDTLLYAGTARLNITDWFFLKDKAELKYIGLEDAVVNMKRTDSVWNYRFIIDYFDSPRKNPQGKKLEFDLRELHLSNVIFNKEDLWIGQNMVASVKELDLKMRHVNYERKEAAISSLKISSPYFLQSNYKGNRPPRADLTGILEKLPVVSAFKWNNSGWKISLDLLEISGGSFQNEKLTVREPYKDRFDGQHILFTEINGTFRNVRVINDTLSGKIDLSAKEKSGFTVSKLSSNMRFTPEIMEFRDLDLVTPNSHLRDYYSMSYKDGFNKNMSNFINDVTLEMNFRESSLHSNDLAYFAPDLSDWNRLFYLQGSARGSVNNFMARDLDISSGPTRLKGNLSMSGLPDINTTFIDLDADELRTTYTDFLNIAPGLRKVKYPRLDKLGNIRYAGTFTGLVNDFVAFGTLQTSLGTINADLNMKLPQRGDPAYSGHLSTNGFNIGGFLDNYDLGNIALNGRIQGNSFSIDRLTANFDGKVSKFTYGDYTYRNIIISGDFKKKFFRGSMQVDDPNLKLREMNGTLSLSGSQISFNVDGNMEHVNLGALGLAKNDLRLSGLFNLNFTGNNIDNFLGDARIYNATLLSDDKKLDFDSLRLSSHIVNERKYLTLNSNEFDAEVSGIFQIMELPDAFRFLLTRYYPSYVKRPSGPLLNQDFSFNIQTRNIEEYLGLVSPRLSGFNNSSVSGNLDLSQAVLNVSADVPYFEFDRRKFTGVKLQSAGTGDTLTTSIDVDDIALSDSLNFPSTHLSVITKSDVSEVSLQTSASKTLNSAELHASIETLADGVNIQFYPSSFIINEKKWELVKDGQLTIRKNYLDANEVRFRQGDQEIVLSTELSDETDQTNIVAELVKVNIGDFAPLIITRPELKGLLTGTAIIRDPFKRPALIFQGTADSFRFDNQYMGAVELDVDLNSNTGLVKFNAAANDTAFAFNLNGTYNFRDSTGNLLSADLVSDRVNLSILEPYLKTVFSKLEGVARTNLTLSGNGKDTYLTGDATIINGALTVAYTQCRYFLENESIIFNKNEIDLGTIQLRDTLLNTGTIRGKMRHNFFQRFYFDDLLFNTSRMLVLNTTKKDNEDFYGNVIGRADMSINGPVTNLQMNIEGEPSATDSSHIYLPTGSSKESSAIDYIEFIQFGSLMEENIRASEAANITVNMNLTANPACKIDVILDESSGDIITGQGNGSIQIRVGTREPLNIRGRYDLTRGEYTFNFQTFFKKPFVLNQGSITWTGDPYLATIDIEAEYTARNVDVSGLNSAGGFNIKEDVTIISHLTGNLQKPVIRFEFRLPERSEIRRDYITVKKLADFQNDENEMNKQVASLLLFNSFVFNDQDRQSGTNTLAIATNTIGGVLSGWLTNLLNRELERATDGIISTYIDVAPTINLANTANQLQANVRGGLRVLLGSRWRLLLGGNLEYNNPAASQLSRRGLLTPDITIEWMLNKDGSIRVVGFNRTSVDYTIGQRNRSGVQLSYRKDLDRLSDIFRSRKKIEQKAAERRSLEIQQ